MTEKIFEDDFELPPMPPARRDIISEQVADEHSWSEQNRELHTQREVYLDEIEVKMAKLNVYWELLKTSLFANPTSITDEVQEEVFDYVKTQVAILMGQKKPSKKKAVKKTPRQHLRSAVMRPSSPAASAVKKTATTQPVATKQSSEIEGLFTPDDYVVETPTVDSQGKLERRYVKQVDTESGKEYYLMAQRMLPGGKWMPDGNRYYKAQNEFGATVFRVINQQFKIIPTIGVAKTNAQFSADSMAHSLEVVQQQSKTNPLIASILGKVTGT
jgi:hypothetical protein